MPDKARLTLLLPAEADTDRLGRALAGLLGPGDAVLLHGPVGAGKTHLARALIRARLGDARAEVPSPTFTLVQVYDTPGAEVWHADLYRLAHPDEVTELGLEAAFAGAVTLVEWPDRLGAARPPEALELHLAPAGGGRRATLEGGRRHHGLIGRLAAWMARAGRDGAA